MSYNSPSIGSSLAPSNIPDAGIPGPADREGTFGTEQRKVVLDTPPFELADAAMTAQKNAEEMSRGRSETQEKKLDDREIRTLEDGPPLDIERIQELLRLIGEQQAGDFAASSKQLLEDAAGGLDLLRSVSKKASDPAKQFLLLAHAFATARRDGKDLSAERLRDALARMEEYHGAKVWGDLHAAEAAATFAAPNNDGLAFREAYRDAVIGEPTLAATLKKMIERFGNDEGRFQSGMEALRRKLAVDLSTLKPSIDKERLHAVLQDLYRTQVVSTMFVGAQRLVKRLEGVMSRLGGIA